MKFILPDKTICKETLNLTNYDLRYNYLKNRAQKYQILYLIKFDVFFFFLPSIIYNTI